ncbi:MAG: hypothetical protein HOY71_25830, partial [Nonomuraea sp.]|nr:hypothetical protein [Nonomuraea sp.]
MTRIALVAVLLVAACAAPSPAGPVTSAKQRLEHARADCMRSRGFSYTPFLPTFPPPTAEELKQSEGDYAAMRAFRQRYGYMVFSGMVYPDDRDAGGIRTSVNDDVNSRYIAKLNPTQAAAYLKADDACFVQAVKQVLHKRVTDQQDLVDQETQDLDREEERTLNTDPRLVALAHEYATCMRARGYEIPSEAPAKIDSTELYRFLDVLHDLGRKDWGSRARPGQNYSPDLTPEQARPYLDKEIASALDDLECSRQFFPVYFPRRLALWKVVR